MTIRDVTPDTVEALTPSLWAWMHEYPEANLDDSAPLTGEAFGRELTRRLTAGGRLWEAWADGEPVGAISYLPASSDTGMLCGICFSAKVHGHGVAKAALAGVIQQLRAEGVRKVSATYFADNVRVRHFLAAAGFQDEGYLYAQTTRHGAVCDLWLVGQLLR